MGGIRVIPRTDNPGISRYSAFCGALSYELSHRGIHWPELDEDVSVAGLLAGRGDQTRTGRAA